MFTTPQSLSLRNSDTLNLISKTRVVTSAILVATVALSISLTTLSFASGGQKSSYLRVSENTNRSRSLKLEGNTISRSSYIFVSIKRAKSVSFFIDHDPTKGNVQQPVTLESYAPFDLGQTASNRTAKPFDFSKLSDGEHTLDVIITKKSGKVIHQTAKFTLTKKSSGQDSVPPVSTTPSTLPNVIPTTTKPQVIPVPTEPVAFGNDTIVYASAQNTPHEQLFISKTDGSQVKQLTNDPHFASTWPRVTPNGKTVYFYRVTAGVPTFNVMEYSLWRVNVDGTGLKEIIPKGANGWWFHGHVDISPDGQRLVFSTLVTFKGITLYTSDMDGKDLREIPTATVGPIDPAYTPDGKVLFTAFPKTVSPVDANMELYIVNVDGSGEKRLTFDTLRDHDPAMSPDGKRISVLTLADPNGTTTVTGNWAQRIMNTDGTNIRFLISPDHYSANARWIDNNSTVYPYWDPQIAGWGMKITDVDTNHSKVILNPQKPTGLNAPVVQSPFAFRLAK